MKNAVPLIVIVVVAVVAIVALDHRREEPPAEPPAEPLDDGIIAAGKSWKVRCGTVDGGTDADVFCNVDGGDCYPMTDISLTNSSATCVRVGPDASVDSTHGTPIGAGCAGGTLWPPHAKVGRCQSEGAAVVVDVTGGRP